MADEKKGKFFDFDKSAMLHVIEYAEPGFFFHTNIFKLKDAQVVSELYAIEDAKQHKMLDSIAAAPVFPTKKIKKV